MNDSTVPTPRFGWVASRRHLAIFLAIHAAIIASGAWITCRRAHEAPAQSSQRADESSRKIADRSRIATVAPLYASLLLSEAALALLVIRGCARHGISLSELCGPRWNGVGQAARDIALGIGSWFVFGIIVTLVATAVAKTSAAGEASGGPPESIQAMLPHNSIEVALWLVVSAAAGFVEEIAYRGYLQRQLAALFQNSAAAIVGQAVIFGLVHLYQGWSSVPLAGALGLVFGCLAAWRKNLRPSMAGHFWADAVAGLILSRR